MRYEQIVCKSHLLTEKFKLILNLIKGCNVHFKRIEITSQKRSST